MSDSRSVGRQGVARCDEKTSAYIGLIVVAVSDDRYSLNLVAIVLVRNAVVDVSAIVGWISPNQFGICLKIYILITQTT